MVISDKEMTIVGLRDDNVMTFRQRGDMSLKGRKRTA